MDHPVAVCAEHCKIICNIVVDGFALLEMRNGTEMMGFNEPLAESTIFLSKANVTHLAPRSMMLLCSLGSSRVSLYSAVEPIAPHLNK